MLEITYSYWDGMGHRKVIQVRKGTTIGRFLELVKQQISSEFNDMKMISSENLLYIKEDLIIAHVSALPYLSRPTCHGVPLISSLPPSSCSFLESLTRCPLTPSTPMALHSSLHTRRTIPSTT
jgi:hypothetical protein